MRYQRYCTPCWILNASGIPILQTTKAVSYTHLDVYKRQVEELMNSSRINELLHKREEDEKKKNCILWVLAIIGAVAAVAGIAYAVYRFFTPDYLEDFEDDFDDDFDDDFFEDEEPEEKKAEKAE